ncbi:MAG: hypothetical protein FJ137_15045 [Deltaproteobacteria bacterium]|nr:hypothetical protein [Deltaproteobacteria bacterium]
MDATVTPPPVNEDERTEKVVVGAAVALALVVGLGFAAQRAGWLDGLWGGGVGSTLKGIAAVIHKEAGGDPQRVLLSGSVAEEAAIASFEKEMKRAFPGAELRNAIRVDKRIKDKKKDIVRISFAADAVNEAWPRPRFGEVKRLEVLWKDEKVMLRGAVFSTATKAALEAAHAALPEPSRGAIQLREVVRAAVPAAKLQDDVSVALAGRSVAFRKPAAPEPKKRKKGEETPPPPPAADVALDTDDANTAAVLDAVAPLLKDLRGLEVLLSAGYDDRATALKQAEAIKAALVARGADGTGLRPVPAPKNNPLALIVREKE